jgi:hypothetical protein
LKSRALAGPDNYQKEFRNAHRMSRCELPAQPPEARLAQSRSQRHFTKEISANRPGIGSRRRTTRRCNHATGEGRRPLTSRPARRGPNKPTHGAASQEAARARKSGNMTKFSAVAVRDFGFRFARQRFRGMTHIAQVSSRTPLCRRGPLVRTRTMHAASSKIFALLAQALPDSKFPQSDGPLRRTVRLRPRPPSPRRWRDHGDTAW